MVQFSGLLCFSSTTAPPRLFPPCIMKRGHFLWEGRKVRRGTGGWRKGGVLRKERRVLAGIWNEGVKEVKSDGGRDEEGEDEV